ncbi:hypothetical protein L6452_37469 [Arctium lappa]|uniref:Uncharacterized protein n=1 Tax=Arctium lappa TaxID=4217 RepID=A0ACB8Y3K4_ARCLA|nr:hypothetical protein L6452_37469 [Arctium lappa]
MVELLGDVERGNSDPPEAEAGDHMVESRRNSWVFITEGTRGSSSRSDLVGGGSGGGGGGGSDSGVIWRKK